MNKDVIVLKYSVSGFKTQMGIENAFEIKRFTKFFGD